MDYEVVAAGHLCVDLTPSFSKGSGRKIEDIFIPGKLINVGKLTISTGGPVSNTGIALKKLGIPTMLMGKVGDDELGALVTDVLKKQAASGCLSVSEDCGTSYTNVIVVPGHDRIFLHSPGANETFCAGDIDYGAVEKARLFHLGYPPLMKRMYENGGRELISIFRRVKELGVTTSLDMSLPDAGSESGRADWEGILQELLPFVDIYLPSVEETMYMIHREAYDKLNAGAAGGDLLAGLDLNELPYLGKKLLDYGAGIAGIKCGEKGFYITTSPEARLAEIGSAKPGALENWAGRELHEESFHVNEVASATGSGDSSIAGFLAAYLRGYSIEECIRIACCLGGQNVQTMDALSGIHSWEESLAMVDGWEKNKLEPDGGYWRYSEARRMFVGKRDLYYG